METTWTIIVHPAGVFRMVMSESNGIGFKYVQSPGLKILYDLEGWRKQFPVLQDVVDELENPLEGYRVVYDPGILRNKLTPK